MLSGHTEPRMKKKRVVLVTIHIERGAEAVPLGSACVASALKAAFTPEPDGFLDISILEAFQNQSPMELSKKIWAADPDLVGFSLYSWNRDRAIQTARELRKSFLGPGGNETSRVSPPLLFCGGPEATASPQGLGISDGGPFDAVFTGEGETAVVRWVREPGTLPPPFPPSEDLSSLPSPWLDGTLEPRGREGVLWELTRGCPYGCTYCYESKGDRHVRSISEERLLGELELFTLSQVPSVFVLDPTFNADKKKAHRVLDLLIAKAPQIHWHFEVRAESLDREMARKFAALGASLQIGLQTANSRVSLAVGRPLDRGRFTSRIDLLNQEGAVFGLDLMYGLPEDTLAGYRDSLNFALSLYPNSVDLFRLAVLPGTILADQARDRGIIAQSQPPYLVQSTPTFSASDLAKAERLSRATDRFYNQGRAVGWFNQILHPLKLRPSVFLEGFADFLDRNRGWDTLPSRQDPVALERLQLAYLDQRFEKAQVDYLLPAVWDIVRFHGAWARALAEGIATDIEFNYDWRDVTGEAALDLEEFVSLAEFSPARYCVRPSDGDVEVVPLR